MTHLFDLNATPNLLELVEAGKHRPALFCDLSICRWGSRLPGWALRKGRSSFRSARDEGAGSPPS